MNLIAVFVSILMGITSSFSVYAQTADTEQTSVQEGELSEIKVPRFWDMVTNLPEDWAIWADETFAKENYGNLIG
ncbi:MAG: hypothetical protein KDD61_03785, partial [Bdellovibrionales bacterium]|nr:hypothetical protein [Bdellovibrionales bacterium]